MKSVVLIIVSLVVAVGAGFGGGYAAASLHYSSSNTNAGVPTITEFKLLRPIIENGSSLAGIDTFSISATESGAPYQAAFQVNLEQPNRCLTLYSGSFYGSLNYTPLSFVGDLFFGSLAPGNYTLVGSVMHGNLRSSKDAYLTVVPHMVLTMSGPHNVNDSSGAVTATFNASVSGGRAPFKYEWCVDCVNLGGPQNYVIGPTDGSSFNVTFSVNASNDFYGTNETFFIGLTVIDSLGGSISYTADSVNGYDGYEVNVTGY